MVDVVDRATRSRMMANIRGKDTRPEIALRKAIHALGLRFRIHGKRLPGTPDIVLQKWKAVIFVHGCFWHRHEGGRYASSPATRKEFWNDKFVANVARDQRNQEQLAITGWRVCVVWECELRSRGAETVASELQSWLKHCGESESAIQR
jgi:DNA mismatch endonuclease, patch repair protein